MNTEKILLFLILCLIFPLFFACNTRSKSGELTEQKRVELLLKEDVNPKTIANFFTDIDLVHIGQSSRSQNQHAYSYNSHLISTIELNKRLSKSRDILKVILPEIQTPKVISSKSGTKRKVQIP